MELFFFFCSVIFGLILRYEVFVLFSCTMLINLHFYCLKYNLSDKLHLNLYLLHRILWLSSAALLKHTKKKFIFGLSGSDMNFAILTGPLIIYSILLVLWKKSLAVLSLFFLFSVMVFKLGVMLGKSLKISSRFVRCYKAINHLGIHYNWKTMFYTLQWAISLPV